jgi:hypothetical protein
MGTSRERYAVVSCHVERMLDDRVWAAFSKLQGRRPGGFGIAALIRPPDLEAGEDELAWLERAHAAATRGPLGHHTHWTSPTHARPTSEDEAAGERVLREGRWLREHGLVPTLFCGGGWYTDRSVAAACATLGYVDCTPRASRPAYLPPSAAWAQLSVPAGVDVGSEQVVVAVPTTHSIGDLVRAVALPRGLAEDVVHVYFHDTDLLVARRARALTTALRLLALRRRPATLDDLTSRGAVPPAEVAWNDIARGGSGPAPQ